MKAVLFDFNGTLFNDTRFHIAAWHGFILKNFKEDWSEEKIITTCIGPNNNAILSKLYGRNLSMEETDVLAEEKEAEYRRAVCEKESNKALRRGAPELFDALVRRGIPFVMATASPASNVRFYLETLGLERWFTWERIVYEDGTVAGKPDPAFYEEAARRVGVSPRDCLIAEDSYTGVQSAIGCGAKRVVLLEGTATQRILRDFPEIYAHCADFIGFEKYLKDGE